MNKKRYEQYLQMAKAIQERLPEPPKIGIILGSALGGLVDQVDGAVRIPYQEIPGMLVATAPTHAGCFVAGRLAGKPVILMAGRFHSYEGYDYEQLDLPVRILKLLGVETLLLTNAAGAVNPCFKVGELMLITDHIKMTGHSPLRGPNLEAFGPRFFDCSTLYTPRLQALAKKVAKELPEPEALQEGVYFFMTGPQYETPAEIRAIRLLGGDAVGMSTVTEALTAAHCGMEVLGFSLLTNMAAGVSQQALSEEEVTATGAKAAKRFAALIKGLLEAL